MVKLSTLAATEQSFEQIANEPQVSTTAVDQNGTLEATPPSTKPAPQPEPQPANPSVEPAQPSTEDISTSSFQIPGEPEPQPQEPATPAQPQTFNWKDEVKKLNRTEILKELGVTDSAIQVDEHLRNGGKLFDYLHANSVDYNNVSEEDLLKEKYKKQFPNLTQPEVNRLFVRKYGVTEDMTEEEKEDRVLQLKADGYTERQARIEEQKKFKIADNPIIHTDEKYEEWKQAQSNYDKTLNEIREFYNSHPATKTLNESKRVTINFGEGVQPFNFSIERPELLTQSLTDGGKMWKQATYTETGEPDVAKQQLISLFALNPHQVLMDVFNYGRKIEERKKVEAGQNAQRPSAPLPGGNQNTKPSYGVGKFGDKQRE